jgi:hypothetical protein
MDKLDLDGLQAKAKAATRGPWKCVAHVESLLLGVQSVDGVPISVIAGDRPLTDMRQAIADNYYIAAACNSVPALVAHIRELEEMNERQRARETRLVEALVSIEEYWNREPTDGAMLDALDVMTRRARAAIEEVNRE